MIFKLNKRGLGLPTVLGIVTFVIAIVASLMTYAIFQAQLVDKNFERTEAYTNAVQAVDATVKIIARDQNLSPSYLTDLEAYMGVSIVKSDNESYYTITSMITSAKIITSYLTGTASAAASYEEIFQNTGQEPSFELSPFVTPSSLMSSYLVEYFAVNFPSITPPTEFASISDIVAYIRTLASDDNGYEFHDDSELESSQDQFIPGHWFIDGNVSIPNYYNLTIPDDRLLVIDGSLTMNRGSTLTGNVLVKGSFVINQRSTTQYLYGTVYSGGDVTINQNTNLGTISRPSFVFTESNISLNSSISGYGYFMSTNFTSNQSSTFVIGGVYATGTVSLENAVIPNNSLDPNLFYSYAVPSSITIETGLTSVADTYEEIFQNTGQELDFKLNSLITPSNLMTAYLIEYFDTNFPSITPPSEFSTISDIVAYIRTLASDDIGYEFHDYSELETGQDQSIPGHWFINGDVSIPNNKNLTIPNDRLLVIDGSLKMNRGSTLTGNVIVDGNFRINTKKNYSQNFYGTVYASGDVTISNDTNLGTLSRPCFVFTESNTSLNSSISGYGYFMSTNFTSYQSSTYVIGGVYATGTVFLANSVIPRDPNDPLNTNSFYSYAVPSSITIEGGGGPAGTSIFKFTTPKLN